MAAWVPAVLVVPAVMAATVWVARPADQYEALRELAPIDVGTTWVYAVTADGKPSGTRTRQVTGQAGIDIDLLDAVTVSSRYTDYPGTGPYSDVLYLGLEGNSLDQMAVYGNHEHLEIDPPAPAYELPLEEGHSWSYEGTVGQAGLRYETELESFEDVESGGRTFTDCAHFVTELSWQYAGEKEFGHEETLEEWTCPGFGPVRSVEQDESQGEVVEELVEFHGASGNWFAEAPDDPVVDDHPGGTVGFDAQRTNAVAGELDERLAWSDGRSARFDFPPVADDEVMVLAERDGEVSAMELTTGEMRWRVRLTGPVVATPTLAGDRVLVADSERNLWALSLTDGSARWVRQFGDMVTDSPGVTGSVAIVPTDDRRVTALDLADGSTAWQVTHGTSVRTAPAVDGDQVVVADRGGEVTAYDVEDGTVRWSRSLEGGLLAGPAVADGHVVVGDDEGIIYALAADSGELDWQERTIFYPSEAFAAGNGAVVSVGDGMRVEAYDLDDGEERWSFDIDTSTGAAIVGDQAVTVDGERVVVRDLADGREAGSWRLPLPNPDASASVDSPLGLVDDTLVFNADLTAPGHNSVLYAYPVNEAGARDGVSFASEHRVFPSTPNGEPLLVGDVLYSPAFDALYRSEGSREATSVFKSDSMVPGVVRAGEDVVVSQKGNQILAYSTDGGEPLWSYASTDGMPGAVPAVHGDTVFVPQVGVGLAAVSLEDGTERWTTAVDLPVGQTPPLPLPDGDVVYGGGALGRFDGETGRQKWSVYDGVLFSSAAYADGLVFADIVRNLSPGGLTAIDAKTGETVWAHENPNTQIIVGPVVAEGVVVHVDSQGLVTAYEAATGEELWQLQLSTTISGRPVVIDGVVYLTEAGHTRDIFQREYRVSAHDLRTGEFLGSYQPPGSVFSFAPTAGGNDGTVLVPGHGAQGAVVMVLRPRS